MNWCGKKRDSMVAEKDPFPHNCLVWNMNPQHHAAERMLWQRFKSCRGHHLSPFHSSGATPKFGDPDIRSASRNRASESTKKAPNGKVDFRELLQPEEFDRYLQLRALRKKIAELKAVLHFTILLQGVIPKMRLEAWLPQERPVGLFCQL